MNYQNLFIIFILVVLIIPYMLKKMSREQFGTDFFHRSYLRDRVRDNFSFKDLYHSYGAKPEFWNCTEKCPNNHWICKVNKHRWDPRNIV